MISLSLSIARGFAHTLSPLLLGTILTSLLFGVTVAQSIWYFRQYPHDPLALKLWIAALSVIDFVQSFSVASATLSVYIRHTRSLDIPTYEIFLPFCFRAYNLANQSSSETLVDLYVTVGTTSRIFGCGPQPGSTAVYHNYDGRVTASGVGEYPAVYGQAGSLSEVPLFLFFPGMAAVQQVNASATRIHNEISNVSSIDSLTSLKTVT
ncbi:hypothetical protein ONZ45_g10805 [Pleurotus djamor]|nr:hypothetical protein ONZ45_g10805 [Pleurotus djamor]